MSTPAELLKSYLEGPKLLRAATAGLSHEQLTARPIAGKWSILEVVVHLADFEPVYADRLRRVLALDTPLLLAADENDFVKRLHYHDRDVHEELTMIEATRASTARLLGLVDHAAWQRTGQHSDRGTLTLLDLLKSAANHIHHHMTFVHEKRAALGLS
jgi:uncharacterized damage-inducible protein DinB